MKSSGGFSNVYRGSEFETIVDVVVLVIVIRIVATNMATVVLLGGGGFYCCYYYYYHYNFSVFFPMITTHTFFK